MILPVSILNKPRLHFSVCSKEIFLSINDMYTCICSQVIFGEIILFPIIVSIPACYRRTRRTKAIYRTVYRVNSANHVAIICMEKIIILIVYYFHAFCHFEIGIKIISIRANGYKSRHSFLRILIKIVCITADGFQSPE